MMYRYVKNYLGLDVTVDSSVSITGFKDYSNVSNYAKEALTWAYAKGIMTGKTKNNVVYLSPKDTATRAECCKMLVATYNLLNNTTMYSINYDPEGCVEEITTQNDKVTVIGWAFDQDSTSTSISVKAYIGSTCLGTLVANQPRYDVNNTYGITGKHGYIGTFTTTFTGLQTVIIKAVDLETGKEYEIGSKTVRFRYSTDTNTTDTKTDSYTTKYDPVGDLEILYEDKKGTIYASGWAYDNDDPNANVEIYIYVADILYGNTKTSIQRDDINQKYNVTGTHGWSLKMTSAGAMAGRLTVKVIARDLGKNTDYVIGTRTLDVINFTTASYRTFTNGTASEKSCDGETSGTLTSPISGFYLSSDANVEVSYSSYIANYGWQSAVTGGVSGNENSSNAIEAIKITAKDGYIAYYRVYLQNIGWLGWAKQGEMAGTTGCATAVTGIQILLLNPNEDSAPTSTSSLPCSLTKDQIQNYLG